MTLGSNARYGRAYRLALTTFSVGFIFLLSLPPILILNGELDRRERVRSDILSCRSIAVSQVDNVLTLDKICGKIP